MSNSKLWQVLPGKLRPFFKEEEAEFINSLKNLSGSKGYDRDDISVLFACLRCGSPINNLLNIAPGLLPGSLLGGYNKIEKSLSQIYNCWEDVLLEPILLREKKVQKNLVRLLPVIRDHANKSEFYTNINVLEREFNYMLANIKKTKLLAEELELEVLELERRGKDSINIGAKLYNPYNPGVYGSPYYLPDRLSSLTPIRVRDILGEDKATHEG